MRNKNSIFILIIIIILAFVLSSCLKNQSELEVMESLISNYVNSNESVTAYHEIIIDNQSLVGFIVEDKNGYQDLNYAHFISKDNRTDILNIIEADKTIEIEEDIKLYEFSNLESDFIEINENDLRIHVFKSNDPTDETLYTADDIEIGTSTFILSNNSNLKKVEKIKANGEVNEKEVKENPSIVFFGNIGEDKEAKYKFYDTRGNIIGN